MILDLLDANRLGAGESLPIKPREFILNALASKVLGDLSVTYGDRFSLKCEKELHGFWDQEAVRRILENLLGNAVKYGSENSVITLELKSDEDFIEISVHNRGNSISEKDQTSLFDTFQRTHSAHDGNQKGWGIGLALVRGYALAHGGHAHMRSTEAEGTTFSVKLPRDSRKMPLNAAGLRQSMTSKDKIVQPSALPNE